LMLLFTKDLNIKRPKRSLWPKYVEPFEILELCGKQAYYLKLPSTWRIHDIINVSCLKKWHGDKHPYERPVIIPDEVEFENRQEYKVECVLNHEKDAEGVLYYRIKWAGFDNPEENTWELVEYLSSVTQCQHTPRVGTGSEPDRNRVGIPDAEVELGA
jgi:hypothetical protein